MAPVVTPGPAVSIAPPSDAIVLFDGSSLAKWTHRDGAPAKWRVMDGAFEVVKGTGTLMTRDEFGDAQLHIEWMSPKPAVGTDQDRGNSGVIFGGGRYEVQVLDSYQSVTYADGQAGALYGQYPPLVDASRPPGEWQSYDIVFRRPRFDASGKGVAPARFTVVHNGVLVQAHAEGIGACWMAGPTVAKDEIQALLGVREPWRMLGAVALGHAASAPKEVPARRPLDRVVTFFEDEPGDPKGDAEKSAGS